MPLRFIPPLQKLVQDKSKLFVVAMMDRPGCRLFCAKLEYTYYPPRTTSNDLFNITVVPWQGINYYVVVLPRADYNLARGVAQDIGMEISKDCPTSIRNVNGKVQFEQFPVNGDNVCFLNGKCTANEDQEVTRIISDDLARMKNDFEAKAVVKVSNQEELDNFIGLTWELGYYSPTMAILFGGRRRSRIASIYLAYILDQVFGAATVDSGGNLLGLFVVPSRRHWGFGTKLLSAVVEHCRAKGRKLTINPLTHRMAGLVARLPPNQQKFLTLEPCISKEDLGELDAKFYKDLKWYAKGKI